MPNTFQLAEAILEMSKRTWIETSKQTADLTESEFLVLDYLVDRGTATVGEAGKHVKLLPAQMSRVLRRLETAGMVSCDINADDRRRVDVTTTAQGRRSHADYQNAKRAPIVAALDRLTEKERSQFIALVQKMARH